MEDVLFSALSKPGRFVSEVPQEGDIGPRIDPTAQRHGLVQQDRCLVEQPVELDCCLDDQQEHIGGDGGPAS